MKGALSITPASTFAEKLGNAASLLASGVTRCVSLATHERPAWDTHDQNVNQRLLFEELFGGLSSLRQRLGETAGPEGKPLAESTVVVIVSEMGRTPILNEAAGRDHWPFTSALVVGPGVRGGRAIGGYTERYVGIGVDEATGDLDPKEVGVDPKAFGATLLALGGADPAELIPGATPIRGVLS